MWDLASITGNFLVRITGDCPLIDPYLVDTIVEKLCSDSAEYVGNCDPPSFPDGLDAEAFFFSTLETAWQQATSEFDREHVTPFIRRSVLNRLNISHETDLSDRRWTVDEPVDFEVVQKIFEYFHPRLDFSWDEILNIPDGEAKWMKLNAHIKRNEGSRISTGQKLWKRARRVIPGGGMLLSKRPEMFLPDKWPTYFQKAKGCRIWDLDGQEYIDMSIMGVGTNILGYGRQEVDEAIRQIISDGNMSTLNGAEDIYLAERLISMHPWADMARFSRTGGEANAIAIRIARSASSRDTVAICGYHGWHDWYLATNLSDQSNLDGHHLSGLLPIGVPKALANSVIPFRYNDFQQLEQIVIDHDVGVIMMEVSRNEPPKDHFLENVRQLATDKGIVLIFDECTSGFRQSFGGLHLFYGIDPDMAIFGKALGNGYAITAVLGRDYIMQEAQNSFISSTFWTERIGPAAALATLDVMENEQSWDQITKLGLHIRKQWTSLANRYDIPIKVTGLPSITNFDLLLPDFQKYKTLITQEMLRNNFLAGTSIFICTEHTDSEVTQYLSLLDSIFHKISDCEKGLSIDSLLDGGICETGFTRLN